MANKNITEISGERKNANKIGNLLNEIPGHMLPWNGTHRHPGEVTAVAL